MATAEQMKLVFRLGEIRFSLPVDHLVEIRQGSAGWIDPERQDPAAGRLGSINQRDGRLDVYDLGHALQLPSWTGKGDMTLLVLSGSDGSWAVPVDEVDGIYPNEAFSSLAVSPLLRHLCRGRESSFELWHETLLVRGDAGHWEHLRG